MMHCRHRRGGARHVCRDCLTGQIALILRGSSRRCGVSASFRYGAQTPHPGGEPWPDGEGVPPRRTGRNRGAGRLMLLPRRHRRITQRRSALLGVFALLLQALLFGWHTHPSPFPQNGPHLSVSTPAPAAPSSPALGDDDCSICLTLHHLGAAPVAFAALPPVPPVRRTVPSLTLVFVAGGSPSGFQARAPPRG